MIIDHRLYTLKSEKLRDWLTLWEKTALVIQLEYIQNFLGMYTTEVGNHNQVIHLWGYGNLGERETRRMRMQQDPRWQDYLSQLKVLQPFVQTESRILRPTSFSPPIRTDALPTQHE
jgi:hypothetical protein